MRTVGIQLAVANEFNVGPAGSIQSNLVQFSFRLPTVASIATGPVEDPPGVFAEARGVGGALEDEVARTKSGSPDYNGGGRRLKGAPCDSGVFVMERLRNGREKRAHVGVAREVVSQEWRWKEKVRSLRPSPRSRKKPFLHARPHPPNPTPAPPSSSSRLASPQAPPPCQHLRFRGYLVGVRNGRGEEDTRRGARRALRAEPLALSAGRWERGVGVLVDRGVGVRVGVSEALCSGSACPYGNGKQARTRRYISDRPPGDTGARFGGSEWRHKYTDEEAYARRDKLHDSDREILLLFAPHAGAVPAEEAQYREDHQKPIGSKTWSSTRGFGIKTFGLVVVGGSKETSGAVRRDLALMRLVFQLGKIQIVGRLVGEQHSCIDVVVLQQDYQGRVRSRAKNWKVENRFLGHRATRRSLLKNHPKRKLRCKVGVGNIGPVLTVRTPCREQIPRRRNFTYQAQSQESQGLVAVVFLRRYLVDKRGSADLEYQLDVGKFRGKRNSNG
ncbi:hypothetical protein B0H16DRAFT_1477061 [Mycena metata]|uniref:Uncharacterized protein n=1 Tax=Mycena metata TaxID=1033252 RepID=A0AAD7HB09_9AGAR|nr:hypothetical protein B0H16DRAFT_1477061 [Mycena metata]